MPIMVVVILCVVCAWNIINEKKQSSSLKAFVRKLIGRAHNTIIFISKWNLFYLWEFMWDLFSFLDSLADLIAA